VLTSKGHTTNGRPNMHYRVFLIPWAVRVKELGWSAFVAVTLFVVVLAVGLLYEWKKGGLEWD